MYTTKEAAQYLGVSVQTIKNYVYKRGILNPVMKGHTLLFSKEELDTLERPRRGKPTKKRRT